MRASFDLRTARSGPARDGAGTLETRSLGLLIAGVAAALVLVFAVGVRAAEDHPRGLMRVGWDRLPPIPPGWTTPPPPPPPADPFPLASGYVAPAPPPGSCGGFVPSTDDERELLEVLPLLKPFLVEDQPLAVRPPRFGRHRFAWSDERPRLVWSGCDVRYEDPSIRPFEVDLEVDLDEAAFETLESHFGVPPVVLGWYRIDDPRFRDAERTLLAERERLGACRGMRLTGRPAYVDPAWLVSQSAPHLAPLSQAILRVWRPVRNGPQYPAWLDGLTSFVQRAVPYRLIPDSPDGRYRGDVRTPGLTALLGGDCDSKSLLLAALIRAVDPNLPIALVLIRGVPIGHAMLAVGVPAADCAATVEAGGQVYVLIESTDGWGIGAASPEFRLSDVEEVIPIP